MNINPIRGVVGVTLNGQNAILRFNNNAFRIVSKKRNMSMTQLFKELGSVDMLELVYDLIEAAYRNEIAYTGQTDNVSSEQFQAWVGEMQDEDMDAILKTIGNAVTLQPAGNAQALESQEEKKNPA
jgi:hypothetical protein